MLSSIVKLRRKPPFRVPGGYPARVAQAWTGLLTMTDLAGE